MEDRRKNTPEQNAIQQKVNDYGMMLGTAAFCMFLVLGVLAYGIVNTNNRAKDVQDKQVRVAACLLEQLAEHRIASQQHHSQTHKHALPNIPYTAPKGVKPPPFNPDDSICREFFPNPAEGVSLDD